MATRSSLGVLFVDATVSALRIRRCLLLSHTLRISAYETIIRTALSLTIGSLAVRQHHVVFNHPRALCYITVLIKQTISPGPKPPKSTYRHTHTVGSGMSLALMTQCIKPTSNTHVRFTWPQSWIPSTGQGSPGHLATRHQHSFSCLCQGMLCCLYLGAMLLSHQRMWDNCSQHRYTTGTFPDFAFSAPKHFSNCRVLFICHSIAKQ